MFDKIKITFTREIQSWLADEGYTHIYQKGIETDNAGASDELNNDYILIPIKEDDSLFDADRPIGIVEEIRNSEISDMADGEPTIRIVVELPVKLYENYLYKQRWSQLESITANKPNTCFL
ncbi:MAG: hypothetical protein JWP81_451 [Ferruginibacter sp.]|nr:hypothetical protein [Ferruginibacter sp.]